METTKTPADTLSPAQLWIAALRSGEYQQGTGRLHDMRGDRWCCLGIACAVYQKHVGDLVIATNDSAFECSETFNGNDATLPETVRRWLGLTTALVATIQVAYATTFMTTTTLGAKLSKR